ncbi:MAG: hypothetical protein WDW36_008409 [Sanguina aurantia]
MRAQRMWAGSSSSVTPNYCNTAGAASQGLGSSQPTNPAAIAALPTPSTGGESRHQGSTRMSVALLQLLAIAVLAAGVPAALGSSPSPRRPTRQWPLPPSPPTPPPNPPNAPNPPSSPSLPPPPAPVRGPVCGFKGGDGAYAGDSVSRFVTINNVRYAGAIRIAVISILGVPFFQITVPFMDGFTPIPDKTLIQYTFLDGTFTANGSTGLSLQAWNASARSNCDQQANQLPYLAVFGEENSLALGVVEPGAFIAFTSSTMVITTPIAASRLFNSWTASYGASSLCASDRSGGIYFVLRIYNAVRVWAATAEG